ncbi:S-adenosyl-L-methionine-dependent methyltransferase [Daldinia sp. FL1419]|nr:S-adenosyl-L-methionine-dependent methyltransferase [Daldinia sp. FL1419]
MPRLPPLVTRRLHATSPLLAALLPACKDLNSARNELRWIREHVWSSAIASQFKSPAGKGDHQQRKNVLLYRLCRLRGRGYPLQYILGSQPFGDLEIKCRPGVLIPRPETEAWTTHLAQTVRDAWKVGKAKNGEDIDPDLKVLDLCTGSGCIALLLYSLLSRHFPKMSVKGVDIEPRAISLARKNLEYNIKNRFLQQRSADAVLFEEADIFSDAWLEPLLRNTCTADRTQPQKGAWRRGDIDILVSNPPYISQKGFDRDTERSVRNYEPRLALVPGQVSLGSSVSVATTKPEDVFYARVLSVAAILKPQFIALEVGDLKQAIRVVEMTLRWYKEGEIEIWRDWPDMQPGEDELESVEVASLRIPVRGSGNGRAVFLHRTA